MKGINFDEGTQFNIMYIIRQGSSKTVTVVWSTFLVSIFAQFDINRDGNIGVSRDNSPLYVVLIYYIFQ